MNMQTVGADRYRVEPTGRGFWPFCVRAGDGERELFIGHRKACERVEDGKFVGSRDALAAQGAAGA